jgi:hypothetical protein
MHAADEACQSAPRVLITECCREGSTISSFVTAELTMRRTLVAGCTARPRTRLSSRRRPSMKFPLGTHYVGPANIDPPTQFRHSGAPVAQQATPEESDRSQRLRTLVCCGAVRHRPCRHCHWARPRIGSGCYHPVGTGCAIDSRGYFQGPTWSPFSTCL